MKDQLSNIHEPAEANFSRAYHGAMLTPFGQDLFLADGPTVSFFGFPYPTRMVAVRLVSGGVWVWSPVPVTSALAESVDRIGPVTSIVTPNKLHHLFLAEWQQRYPDARLYAPPDLERRKPDLRFHARLTDSPEISWSGEIDQVVFRGSFAMAEVVFYHRLSRTAIFGDLIQRFPAETTRGWKGILMRLSGLVGPHGTTPIDWRLSFISRSGARAARRKCLDWNPERLVIAHGMCASSGATEVIEAALSWI